MGTTINQLITKRMPWHAGMTELNHLMRAGNAKPQLLDGPIAQIFSSRNINAGGSNPLSSLTLGNPLEVTSNSWEWEMRGATQKPLVVLEDIDSTNTHKGYGRTSFRIKLSENWYTATDVIDPGTAGHKYQCRIMSDPIREGNGYVYECRLVGGIETDFVPNKYFTPGTTWSKLYSTAEEGSYQSGSTQYSNTIALMDSLGKIKKKYEVTDYAVEEVLQVGWVDNTGKRHLKWLNAAELEFHLEWQREIERALFYNRKDGFIKGATGRPVNSFSGIQEKVQSGYVHVHSGLTAKLLQEYFMGIFYSRMKLEEINNLVGFTGYYGMLNFHELMNGLAKAEGWTMTNNNFSPIKQVSSPQHKNAFSYGYKFTEWNMPMGGTFKLIHNPLYDDVEINRELDPITGYPLESQRITFLDFTSDSKNNSNVRIVNKVGGYKFWYVAGGVSPYGPMQGTLGSTAREGYEMHYSKELGVHIQDVTKCGELILDRN